MVSAKHSALSVLTLLAAGLLIGEPVAAQWISKDIAQRKQHPGSHWQHQRAARSMQHARDYSHGLYNYVIEAPMVTQEVAQAEAQGIARNLEATQRELATVRQAAPQQDAIQQSLAKVEQHLKAAAEMQKKLQQECQKAEGDQTAVANCCSDLTKELDQAIAEHAALMRKLDRVAVGQGTPPTAR